jgi:hypothetical protein
MKSPPSHRSVRQGRRPSVESTTARRCPSARRRPGAGFLPAWPPVARVRLASKERFRVYSEDEYFARSERIPELTRDGSARRPIASEVLAQVDDLPEAGGARLARGVVAVVGIGALAFGLAFHLLASTAQVRRRALLRAARPGTSAGAAPAGARRPSVHARQQARPRSTNQRRARPRPSSASDVCRDRLPSSRATVRSAAARDRGARAPRAREVGGSPQVPTAPARQAGGASSQGAVARDVELAASSGSAARGEEGEFGFER